MSDSPFVIEVTEANFQEVVLQGSMKQPVLVDFWADWCAPCRSLMPVLAKLADEYNGQFILAKINSDEQQELATQYGIRSLPTVKLFKNGQPVDEFMGALPEGQVKEFLDKHIDKESDKLRAQAIEHYRAGNRDEAMALLQKAYEIDPYHLPVVHDFIGLLAQSNRFDECDAILNALPREQQDSDEVKQMQSQVHFARLAASGEDPQTLQKQLETSPDDLITREKLANLYIGMGHYAEGLEQFLEIMKRDRSFNDDAGRKGLLQAFDMIGSDPLVDQYRQKMFALLY